MASKKTLTDSIDLIWERIEAALAKQAPDVLATLGKPAKSEAIAKLEVEFGCALPESLKQSWSRHDGQDLDDESLFLFADAPFFGIKAVRAERKEMLALAKSLGNLKETDDFVAWAALVKDGVGSISGPVKARDFQLKWLPIGSVNADVFRYLDFDPAPGGTPGQVIEVDPENVSWRVIAPSFDVFLDTFARALEGGKIDWQDPDDAGSGSLFPRQKGLPAYLKALPGVAIKLPKAAAAEPPADLDSVRTGQTIVVTGEVSRIFVGTNEKGVRLDLANGVQVWADASKDGTSGFKQITMRARGSVTLERLPGKKLAFRLVAFSQRKG